MHGIMAAAGRIERVLLKDAIHDVFSIFINMYISHNSSIRLLTLLSFIIILFKRALRIRGGGGVWVAQPGVWRCLGQWGMGARTHPSQCVPARSVQIITRGIGVLGGN